MKIRRRLLLFAAIILFVALCATPFIVQGANPPAKVQITSRRSGAALITDNDLAYQLTVPAGWYPVALPPSQPDVNNFNALAVQQNLRFEKDWVSSLPGNVLRFVAVDLDATAYEDNGAVLIAAPYAYTISLAPDGTIQTILKIIDAGGAVTATSTMEISGQEVGIVEFVSPAGSDYFFGGKMLAFIRRGRIILIVGVANKPELVPTAVAAVDKILASLIFLDPN